MVHILWLILKIIGIILLVILALCLLILFFPVTYRVKGDFAGKDFHILVRCGWLFHLLHFGGDFSNKEHIAKIRILGIPINLIKDESESEKRKKHSKNKKQKHGKDKTFSKDETENKEEKIIDSQMSEEPHQKYHEKKVHDKTATRIESGKKKKNFLEKIKEFYRKLCIFFKKVRDTIQKALKNIEGAYNKAKEIKQFITANTTKEAYRYGKKIIIKTIKHIFPTKIKANIHFGLEQPDLTGKMLGYLAMVFSVLHVNVKRISIIPDFDEKIIEGNIKLKGHFFVGILLVYVLKFYFKKEIHDIIKKYK